MHPPSQWHDHFKTASLDCFVSQLRDINDLPTGFTDEDIGRAIKGFSFRDDEFIP